MAQGPSYLLLSEPRAQMTPLSATTHRGSGRINYSITHDNILLFWIAINVTLDRDEISLFEKNRTFG